jgi:hypothetical protein
MKGREHFVEKVADGMLSIEFPKDSVRMGAGTRQRVV